ncbi:MULTISPECIES: hypothetical protein [unclassified Duganella]|jgi:hypothetical protein|uniref:hypothetical protein n=1 Tax=unclassified Duganella TaxID=2636909 RepID=UPI0008913A04|nr:MULTISPECIES: hypothetical protein [unclassified Duganella]SDG94464.1 hypothetical protein SAMN05216320_108191 [Duganella sp. OV458]SDJ47913.1 hypothetical protein SAMN05428973_104256 [Duganella sp. OV510]
MVTIQISLPDDLVRDATELGLLDASNLEAILRSEIREHAFQSLLSIAPRLAAAGVQPLSEEEVVAEVRAARAEQYASGT